MRKWAFWILAGATLALYLAIVLWSLPTVTAEAGGLTPFDLRPGGYSFEEARAFLAALTPEGVAFYDQVQHRLDIFFPALIALTLYFAIAALLPRSLGGWRFVLATPALLLAPFDWLENAAVGEMLHAGAEGTTSQMASAASGWTQAKSLMTTVVMSALLLLLIWKAGAAIARRRRLSQGA
jgi:hypothetical protein